MTAQRVARLLTLTLATGAFASQVQTSKKVTVLYAVENDKLRFRYCGTACWSVCIFRPLIPALLQRSLREEEGEWVEKPPWKIEWGGGASVESPHFQRVHYCELLVRATLDVFRVYPC